MSQSYDKMQVSDLGALLKKSQVELQAILDTQNKTGRIVSDQPKILQQKIRDIQNELNKKVRTDKKIYPKINYIKH